MKYQEAPDTWSGHNQWPIIAHPALPSSHYQFLLDKNYLIQTPLPTTSTVSAALQMALEMVPQVSNLFRSPLGPDVFQK